MKKYLLITFLLLNACLTNNVLLKENKELYTTKGKYTKNECIGTGYGSPFKIIKILEQKNSTKEGFYDMKFLASFTSNGQMLVVDGKNISIKEIIVEGSIKHYDGIDLCLSNSPDYEYKSPLGLKQKIEQKTYEPRDFYLETNYYFGGNKITEEKYKELQKTIPSEQQKEVNTHGWSEEQKRKLGLIK
jgi:hypothetical protein